MRPSPQALRDKQLQEGFIQAEKQGQEIAEGCKRLIKNGISCSSTSFLITRATSPFKGHHCAGCSGEDYSQDAGKREFA
jgi:hypothetical protein